jgi:hypothetical protein
MTRKAAHNSTYPKGGVWCSKNKFVQAESSVLRMKFSGKNPALRVAAKRCVSYKKAIAQTAHLVFADTRANAEKTKRAVFLPTLDRKLIN